MYINLLLTIQLLDHKCGCKEGCHYTPGSFIDYTNEATVITLLQEAYSDVSFLQNIIDRIVDVSMITHPPIPPMDSGENGDITDSTIPEPNGEL